MSARRRRPASDQRRRRSSDATDRRIALLFLLVVGGLVTYVAVSIKLQGGHLGRQYLIYYVAGALAFVVATGLLLKPVAVWSLQRYLARRRRPIRPGGPVAMSREPIPAGLRFAVLRRDGFRCAYCGRGEGEGVKLHIDHLVPVARGGLTELENLVTACATCNIGKSATDLIGAD